MRGGTRGDTALCAVVADVVVYYALVSDNSFVDIDIANDGLIHVDNSRVVKEPIVIPAPTVEAMTEISEAIIDAPIPADFGGPEAIVENEGAIFLTPPGGRPEKAWLWGRHQEPGTQ